MGARLLVGFLDENLSESRSTVESIFWFFRQTPNCYRDRRFQRVSQGGHDVPDKKLRKRFERTRSNLELRTSNGAIQCIPQVVIYSC